MRQLTDEEKAHKEEKRERKEAQKPKNRKKRRLQKQSQRESQLEKPFFLFRFNQSILHLFLTPIATLLYYPINKYVILPWLGNGDPYTNSHGKYIEYYFSANHMAALLAFFLFGWTLYRTIQVFRQKKASQKWKRILFLFLCIYVDIVTVLLFLNFSLWS